MHFINCGESNDSSIPAAPLLSTFLLSSATTGIMACMCVRASERAGVHGFEMQKRGRTQSFSQPASVGLRLRLACAAGPTVDHHGGELQLMSP